MPWKTHSEYMQEQMANPEYASTYAEMKADLDREFQIAEEHKSQQSAEGSSADSPVQIKAGRNGASRDVLSGEADRADAGKENILPR